MNDSDVALIGTGIAPLIAASHLISQGKSVLVLNPDYDFFLEDSELPLDPMLPLAGGALGTERLRAQDADRVLEELRPPFPGAVEAWSTAAEKDGFHDLEAPHVRQRARLWIPRETDSWSLLEDAYVGASDAGLNPKILEGLPAAKRFPGFGFPAEGIADSFRGLLVPKICDVDVSRYRNGVLEFVRERLGSSRFVVPAAQIEPMPGGLRFYSGGKPFTARVREQVLVFWTPRMTSWVLAQSKRAETEPRLPSGVRLWEQWSLISREDLDPEIIGTYAGLVVWAEVEGRPIAGRLDRLSVLRSGPLLGIGEAAVISDAVKSWASGESLGALSSLCYEFLNWSRFSVRSMKARALFEWASPDSSTSPWDLKGLEPRVRIVPRCDGPLVHVIRATREACA